MSTTTIEDLISKAAVDWNEAREAVHFGEATGVSVRCSVERRTDAFNMDIGFAPADLQRFWNSFRRARLFEDVSFGQWGLALFDCRETIGRTDRWRCDRPDEYLSGDLVAGEFLGDGELLIVRGDRSSCDYAKVLIALPIDPRIHWYVAADSLRDFVESFIKFEGAKFWEVESRSSESDRGHA